MVRMKVSRSNRWTQPFVLDEEAVRKLAAVLEGFRAGSEYETLRFSAECSDGFSRTFESADDLVEYENPSSRQIEALSIRYLEGVERTASLWVGRSPRDNVELTADGPAGHTETFVRGVEDTLQGAKPWYSWIATISLARGLSKLVYLYLAVWSAWFVLSYATGGRPLDEVIASLRSPAVGWVLLVGVSLVVVTELADWGRRHLFPCGTFAIGQGRKRHKDREIVRILALGLLGSGVLGVAISLIL